MIYLHDADFWGSLDVESAQVLSGRQADIAAVPGDVQLDDSEAVHNCGWDWMEPASHRHPNIQKRVVLHSCLWTVLSGSKITSWTMYPGSVSFPLISMRKKSLVSLAAARSSLQVARSGFFALPDRARATASSALVGRSNRLGGDLLKKKKQDKVPRLSVVSE